MKNIDTLSSIEGRTLLMSIYKELRYEKQLSSLATLFQCWRICTNEREIFKFSKQEVTIVHPLGFFSGTALWMEEVVNRFYFSTINSFVYFGAAILLVLIGIRRFSDSVSDNLVIFGVAFEALMLMFMFVVMLFTPNEEIINNAANKENEAINEIVTEIGEIGRDFAAAVVQLEEMGLTLQDLIKQQKETLNLINKIAETTAEAVAPNPQMIETMEITNKALAGFSKTVCELHEAAEKLKREEIELAVKREVERILLDRFTKT
jgi:methyl-accepting chemotaxis protein